MGIYGKLMWTDFSGEQDGCMAVSKVLADDPGKRGDLDDCSY